MVLTAFKFGVAHLSGSVGIFSEGVHSFLDLVSAAVSFFTVREAGRPADEDHPFGHGKIETLSSLFESVLLIVAAILIFREGMEHIFSPVKIRYEFLAIGTILLSLLVSYFMFTHNRAAAEDTESSALHVNSLHFLSDVVASAGVLIGLVLMKLTGWLFIDPLIAFGVAFYVLSISVKQARHALLELADTHLPEGELTELKTLLAGYASRGIEAHNLRTRKSGATRHIDFHVNLCRHMTVQESHEICDDVEEKILNRFPSASVNIHVEPCSQHKNNPECHLSCDIYNNTVTRVRQPRGNTDGK